ncbi:autophagy-related protein 9B isoform X3 [Pteropus vampyrus]|uniref:Autophagy-related protein 9 n=1 Tax=Pteropus vampyrus TaxID=132908 RepID=A0A6P3R7K3_PTEVA|nr:autophagy-related protein 9B isoform X3 [Pteropus vampyrus]
MVRRTGWGGSRGRLGLWGDLGPGSMPLLPMPLPPLPPPPCRRPGGGRVSIFSLSPAPHTRSVPSSVPPLALGSPRPAAQAPGASQPCHSALPTPATPPTQGGRVMTPISAPPSWGSHSTPPLASATPPPSCRCPQDNPGLRIGPLIPEQDYERLGDCDPEGSQESPIHGEEQQPLLHVPEGLRGSWHHIQNLDCFFTKIYSYHQRNGFACILLEDVFQLGQFVFIVAFTTFLLRCVDYNVLFANQPNNRTRPGLPHSKVTLSDAILPSSQCAQRIHSSHLLVLLLILAAAFWLVQLLRSVCNLFSYWDIQVFYREALHIPPVLHAFYSHVELLRREPGALGARRWSRLARLQLRHFNELPHELRARLARAYRPAAAFLRAAAPPAPLLALLARQLVFFAGALFAALLVLTVYDEDVLAVEHVLTAMTALGVTATVARSFVPDEQCQGRSPQLLLQSALAHMHYLPDDPGAAGKASAYRQMARLLQYRAVSLLEELLSPLLTPLFLLFWFRPRALEIIDFFHHFTVDVAGVGDICSFALMDVKRHGHPQWLSEGQTEASLSQRAEDGKTELSLMRFSLVHPQWRPPGHSSKFLGHLRGRVQQDAAAWGATSVRSPPTPRVLSDSSSPLPEAFLANLLVHPLMPPRDLSPTAPCPAAATASLLASISRIGQDPSCVSPGGTGGQKLAQLPELASAEMSLHAIYLHQLHQQQQQEPWGEASSLSRPWSSPPQTLSPDDEKPSWSSDGSSPASSPRQQWRTQRTQNLFPEQFQETTDTQKEPGQAPGTD